MFKRSIFAMLARLLCTHLFYIIDYCQNVGFCVSRDNRMIAQVPAVLSPRDLD